MLRDTWQSRARPELFFAGQVSGVEGYVESAASGLLAGRNAAAMVRGGAPSTPPRTTAIGALAYYVSHAKAKYYQPSNITFGIMAPLESVRAARPKGADRKRALSDRALTTWTRGWPLTARESPGETAEAARRRHARRLAETAHPGLHRVPALQPQRVRSHRPRLRERSGPVSDIERGGTSTHAPVIDRRRFFLRQVRLYLGAMFRDGASRAPRRASWRPYAPSRAGCGGGLTEGDPAALAGTPSREHKIPVHLSIEEMSKLLETPDRGTPLGRRDQAMLELFYASGLRLSELTSLDLDD